MVPPVVATCPASAVNFWSKVGAAIVRQMDTNSINKILRVMMYSPSETDLLPHVLGLILRQQHVEQAGAYLASLAEMAYKFRKWSTLGEAISILSHLPSDRYSALADFYRAHYLRAVGEAYNDESEQILTGFMDNAPDNFRARSVLSLATFHYTRQDYPSAMELYRETIEQAHSVGDFDTFDAATKMIGNVYSVQGDPKRALEVYSTVYPSLSLRAKYSLPAHIALLDLLNSYALDLAEVGRLSEAHNLARRVAASPFANVYREFGDTLREIEAKQVLSTSVSLPMSGGKKTLGEMRNLLLAWLVDREPRQLYRNTEDAKLLIKMYEVYESREENP